MKCMWKISFNAYTVCVWSRYKRIRSAGNWNWTKIHTRARTHTQSIVLINAKNRNVVYDVKRQKDAKQEHLILFLMTIWVCAVNQTLYIKTLEEHLRSHCDTFSDIHTQTSSTWQIWDRAVGDLSSRFSFLPSNALSTYFLYDHQESSI